MASWLVTMENRGRLRRERDRNVADLRAAVATVADAGVRAALEKDLHLTEAAVLNRIPVASHDNKQRRYLVDLVTTYTTIGRIQWFSPIKDPSDVWHPWVAGGCSESATFRVGAEARV
jgi:hypothetical protein